uniref:F-box domain-containing protein n=1 Tax=Acrobeloides nanus TaxID=290746 RepID=A0A914DM36_9BILA
MKRQCLWCHKILTTNSKFNDQLDGPVEIPENASIRRACKISQKRKRKANTTEATKKKKIVQVKKFCEDGCEQILATTSSWKHVPMEIMCDILKFNSRNEIEKFQWVSKKWNNIIKRSAPVLPLRSVYLRTSGYKYHYPIISTKNYDYYGPNLPLDPIYIKSLETCIIKEVFFGIGHSNSHFYDLEKEMFYLRMIPNILGHRAKVDLFNSYINAVNSCGDQIKYLKEIFEEIFEAKRVEFHIDHILFENILQNPSLIEEADLPLQMEIKSLERTKKFSCTSIAAFINQRQDMGRRSYTFEIGVELENFCKEYVQMFLNTEKPEAFIKEIKIDHPIDIKPAIDYMSSLRNVKFYHKDFQMKNGQTKKFCCYEVSREDNWSVEYAFYHHDRYESMVFYSVYKSEQQI